MWSFIVQWWPDCTVIVRADISWAWRLISSPLKILWAKSKWRLSESHLSFSIIFPLFLCCSCSRSFGKWQWYAQTKKTKKTMRILVRKPCISLLVFLLRQLFIFKKPRKPAILVRKPCSFPIPRSVVGLLPGPHYLIVKVLLEAHLNSTSEY